ncbi:unnamed protein product [Mytilus coruscus]|uniref:Uncharacterized protein n=1 Tax=Mytilus coruscus TaxID=42192 RepID=A0A6J7ZZ47_MYTCO|nr:unnamed protein product [Mytilus coruscus]
MSKPSGMTNNIAEGMNTVIKGINEWKEVTIYSAVLSFHYLQVYYCHELLRGLCGTGDYYIDIFLNQLIHLRSSTEDDNVETNVTAEKNVGWALKQDRSSAAILLGATSYLSDVFQADLYFLSYYFHVQICDYSMIQDTDEDKDEGSSPAVTREAIKTGFDSLLRRRSTNAISTTPFVQSKPPYQTSFTDNCQKVQKLRIENQSHHFRSTN